MKIIILGSGFLSSAYQFALTRLGYAPVVLSRAHSNYCDPKILRPILEEQKPDILLNCAGFVGRTVDDCEIWKDQCFRANAQLPFDVAVICADLKIPMIHLSSGCIFHGPGPFKETDAPNPQSYYAEAKLLAEEKLSELEGARWIFRIRVPFSHTPSPRNLITKLIAYPKILESLNSCTWADQFAMRSWQLAWKAPPGIYHATCPGPVSIVAVAEMLKSKGLRGPFEVWNEKEFLKAHVQRSAAVLDNSKFGKAYGEASTDAMGALEWCADQMVPKG